MDEPPPHHDDIPAGPGPDEPSLGQTAATDDSRRLVERLRLLADLAGDHAAATEDSFQAATTLGDYRIIRKVGAGGMGAVYEAEQLRPVRRRVALKVIKAGMDTDQVIARFESERQALALMNHPNIARIYDAGSTEEGHPFFAMELVHGEPLTAYCDQHRLPIRSRLELLLAVCDGVRHAHQKGVIHRDLKPSNVLVTTQDGQPVPKIIDFGVAKAISYRLTEHTLLTEAGQLIGTPEYMSPEQADPMLADVDTRADVYSLGVILYELLVGAKPLDSDTLRGVGLDQIRRILREQEPPRPSTRLQAADEGTAGSARNRGTSAGGLARELRGDLDWIAMKALEKDPARRYESVGSLAADIQRHLRNEPVAAGPPSAAYRARKFVRRHRVGVLVAGGVVTALLVGLSMASIGFVRASRTEARARREAATSDRVAQFMTDLFTASDPSEARGNTVTAREILDRGVEEIRKELHDEPAVRAALMKSMGSAYHSLGLNDASRSLLQEAADIQTRLYGPNDHAVLSYTLNSLAITLRATGDLDGARALYERILKIRTAALDPGHPDLAELHNNYATLLYDTGDYVGSKAHFEQAVASWERSCGPDCSEITGALRSLGTIAADAHDFAGAKRLLRRALRISEAAWGSDHPETAMSLATLGLVHNLAQEPDSASVVLERALALDEKIFGPQHVETARTLNLLASAREGRRDYQGARELYLRVIELRRASGGPRHHTVANPMYHLATVEAALGETNAALVHYSEAASILSEALGPTHPNLPYTLIQHGKLLVRLKRYQEADALFARARGIWEAKYGAADPHMAQLFIEMGSLESARGHAAQADSLYARALRINTLKLGPEHRDTGRARNVYAEFLRASGQAERAQVVEAEATDAP